MCAIAIPKCGYVQYEWGYRSFGAVAIRPSHSRRPATVPRQADGVYGHAVTDDRAISAAEVQERALCGEALGAASRAAAVLLAY